MIHIGSALMQEPHLVAEERCLLRFAELSQASQLSWKRRGNLYESIHPMTLVLPFSCLQTMWDHVTVAQKESE